MPKQYEVPYNFSYDFVPKLSRKRELFSYIRCIYLPAYREDATSTRQDIETREEYPKSYDEYVLRLKCLQKLGLPICVLMQRNASLDVLEKYYDLGIRIFTITDDALAIAAKSRHPDISVTLSITSALTENNIKTRDLSMYDHIVLFYWFSRHLDALKDLPEKYRYILIPNTDCYWNCKWHDAHWFAASREAETAATSLCRKCIHDMRDTSYIEPENLSHFDPYIDSYKLVDRLNTTDQILTDLERYAFRNAGAQKREEAYFNVD